MFIPSRRHPDLDGYAWRGLLRPRNPVFLIEPTPVSLAIRRAGGNQPAGHVIVLFTGPAEDPGMGEIPMEAIAVCPGGINLYGPIHYLQPANASEFARIVCDQNDSHRNRMRSDEHIHCADRRTGLPMADSVIFATAQVHGAVLWTQDADLEHLAGVRYRRKKP